MGVVIRAAGELRQVKAGNEMSRDWHELFKSWAKPPSETEEEKGSRAARMVNDALRSSDHLNGINFKTYSTGSYRNNTNVKLSSDIDIAVVYQDLFYYETPNDFFYANFGISTDESFTIGEFRRHLYNALKEKFGEADVVQHNKTFSIKENSGRLPADVTPFFIHRKYTGHRNFNGTWHSLEGVETRAINDPELRVINWHDQHYDNGVKKNGDTNRRYKRVVRILKKLKIDMIDNGVQEAISSANVIPSFLLECLAYNVDNSKFNLEDGSYYNDVREVIKSIWNTTSPDQNVDSLYEVNRIKLLFGDNQKWSQAQAHKFMLDAWKHIGFPSI